MEPQPVRYETDRKSLERDSTIKFSRSSGPGGQNVNKINSKVRIRHASGVVVEAEDTPSQARNKQIALGRLQQLVRERQRTATPRIRTNIPEGQKKQRLSYKHNQSILKKQRKRPEPDED